MTCPGCSAPDRGIVIAGCRECQLRDIALGPHFMASLRCGRLTPEYAAQLRTLGTDIEAIHQEAKRCAKAIKTGAIG